MGNLVERLRKAFDIAIFEEAADRITILEAELEYNKAFITATDTNNKRKQAHIKELEAQVTAGYEAGWHALRQERDDLKTKLGAVRSRCQQLIIESDRRLDNVIWIQEAALEK